MMGSAAFAENLNQDSGTVNDADKTAYNWEYWNDVKTDADYAVWPNWKVTYATPLDAAPANIAINYVLKKDSSVGPVVATGAANTSFSGTEYASFYAGPIAALGDGTFVMESTVTFIPAGATDPQITNFTSTFESKAAPEAEYHFTFTQTTIPGADKVTINYAFEETDGKDVPEGAEYSFEPGIIGFANQPVTGKTGTVEFVGLTPNTTYTLWSNNPKVKLDGKAYATNYPNWEFTTLDGPSTAPVAKLVYTLKDASANTKGEFNYTIELENIDEADVVSYKVWLDAPGNVTMGSSDTKAGTILVDVPDAGISVWAKGQVTYKDGEETKTISTNPNDVECKFKVVANPDAEVPAITLVCANPTPLTATTGTIDYTITTDKPELEGVKYKLYAQTTGDVYISAIEEVTELTGKLNLINLNNFAVTEIWVKAQAITADGGMSDLVTYPGADLGWTGFSIDTSTLAGDDDPILPTVTLTASNPEVTSTTAGTLEYKIELSGDKWQDKFFKAVEIYVVTNAFGGADVEVARKTITDIADLEGVLDLSGLKESAKNDLWVKATLTLTDDSKSEEVTYPGAAQGWTGLTIDTSTFAPEGEPVLPTITLTASNAVATSPTTGTLDYKIELTGKRWEDKFLKNVEVYVVTNAFGGADVEVARKTITEIADLEGVFDLEGLKEGTENGLWVKATVTLTNDVKSEEITYPGAAQGWTGLSVTTPKADGIDSVLDDNDAPAVYYNLQGQKVENPESGLYIVVKGNKATKVIL